MRTRPPDLADAALLGALARHWAIDAAAATYLPVGFGSHHWTVGDGTSPWFVTVDDLVARRWATTESLDATFDRIGAALTAARELADDGLGHVVAPEWSCGGEVLVSIDDRFAVAVYRHVEGDTREYGDFARVEDRMAVLERLIPVHAASGTSARTETLEIPMYAELRAALGDLDSIWTGGPHSETARRHLRRFEADIGTRLVDLARLAAHTLDRPDRFVLTHGEPHPGNTISTAEGLVLVDWDTALVAPPERDLWTVAGPHSDRQVLDAYTAATGTAIDDDALATYRLHWDVSEIALYTALLRDDHDDTEDIRASSDNLASTLQSWT